MSYHNAIIGYSGFIGSNISINAEKYNSSNINFIKNKSFENVLCCAPSATKWLINKQPDRDKDNIANLLKILKTIKCKKFVLFSTIDTETFTKSPSYGSNRLFFEKEVQNIFNVSVVRLPALFGKNLKKNMIFDLMNQRYEFVNINSSFQWLDVTKAVNYALCSDVGVHRLYPEPIETLEIIDLYFPEAKSSCVSRGRIEYNIKPKDGYFLSKEQVLKDIEAYLEF